MQHALLLCGAPIAPRTARHVGPSGLRCLSAPGPSPWLGVAAAATPRGSTCRCCAGKPPDSGYFAEADPSAEVLPVKSGLSGDITQRSKSRWESDFIWNKNWSKQLDYEESLRKQQQEGEAARHGGGGGGDSAGFLRLRSKVDLNSMEVDLSQQLRARKQSRAAGAPSATASSAAPAGDPHQQRQRWLAAKFGSDPPTRVEQRTWQRSGKYSRKVMAVAPTTEASKGALAAKVEAERKRYDELKQELQAWAAGLTAACLAATFAFYGRDVAASYGVGALGGLLYLRLLNRSVDSVGEGLGGALGQPRLLIPVVLALGYNRYNTMVGEQTGLTLSLLPMLLGFFTYKGAMLGKQSLVLFRELTDSAAGSDWQGGGSESVAGQGDSTAVESASVDRAFRKKLLSEI